jgi:dihydrolipoamide dehydrogenase
VAAVRAAELGREVVVVERAGAEGGLGGCCLHVGCIPSKALIELSHAFALTEDMAGAGLVTPAASVDMPRFQAHRRSIVDGLAGGVAQLFKQHGVRHLTGDLRFNKRDRAAVLLPNGNAQFLEFKQAIIATGSRPTTLPSLPPDGERVLTSTGALALDALPASLAVVGGGYIGLEIGMAYARLGVKVSIVEALDRILPTVDEALTKPVLRSLKRLGVDVHLSSLATGLDGGDLVFDHEGREGRAPAEKIVVAIGRRPNTDELGLDAAGIPVGGNGLIAVDKRRLATPRVAAVGDVTAGPALAHKASAEGTIAAEALCGLPAEFDPMAIPAVVFTDPEIATVGLTEAEARAAGYEDVRVGTSPLAASGRAATMGRRDGFTRVVVDGGAERVLGVHVVGPHASELIAEGALAVEMTASPEDIAGTIHPHPTLGEAVHAAAEQLLARSLAG